MNNTLRDKIANALHVQDCGDAKYNIELLHDSASHHLPKGYALILKRLRNQVRAVYKIIGEE